MENTFLFSNDHLIMLLIFSVFLYLCPKLTKHLLPYSYIVEKVICILIILEITFEQFSYISMGSYDVYTCLPIRIYRFASYICIAILFFKNYQLFNIFFSWSLVCSIGGMIFFPSIGYRYPNILYYLFFFSNCILVYTTVYLTEVRKFSINKYALRDNFNFCILYFSFIYFLNTFTNANYPYIFSSYSLLSAILFTLITTIIYIPILFFNRELTFNFRSKKK